MCAGIDVDPMSDAANRAVRHSVGGLQQVGAAGLGAGLGHPHHHGVEVVCSLRFASRRHQQIAPADVDVVGERHRYRPPWPGEIEVAVEGGDPFHRRAEPRRQRYHFITRPERSRGDGAGIPAEVRIGARHQLHRHAEVHGVDPAVNADRFEVIQQRRPVEPTQVVADVDDIVAQQRRHRQEVRLAEPERLGERAVVLADLGEPIRRPADEVHLVDRDHHPADAQQAGDVAVALGLGQHTVAGIDQDDREVAGRGAGRHVARVLGVPGGVGDDELPPGRGEVAVRHVDGDALLPLGPQAVHQQRQIDLVAC